MPKLSLNPSPTFSHPVEIPRPGADPATVVFTFKHRDREQLDKWLTLDLPARAEKVTDGIELDTALILDCASGWDLEDEFNAENVGQLVRSYGGAPLQVYRVYLEQLRLGKQKN